MNKTEMKSLYDNNLIYNANYYVVRKNNTEYCLVFLGTSSFVLLHNYYGTVAYGKRSFNFDKKVANYEVYHCDIYHLYKTTLEYILAKYEKTKLHVTNTNVKFDETEGGDR